MAQLRQPPRGAQRCCRQPPAGIVGTPCPCWIHSLIPDGQQDPAPDNMVKTADHLTHLAATDARIANVKKASTVSLHRVTPQSKVSLAGSSMQLPPPPTPQGTVDISPHSLGRN